MTYSAQTPTPKNSISLEDFRNKLKLKSMLVKKSLMDKYPDSWKYLGEMGVNLDKLRVHSGKIISAASLTSSLIFSPVENPTITLPDPLKISSKMSFKESKEDIVSAKAIIINNLKELLTEVPRPLNHNEEKVIELLIEQQMGVKAKASLEGEHLNTTYGYIGAEQHLRRYPGDVLENHGVGDVLKEGIAPGLGAWGYFAPSKDKLTTYLDDTEKWYAVVQTLYLPDWNTRQPYLRNWYKYRKVLILNTKNGNAVVAAIADSGPAAWTGKQFGGSPEVMEYLGGERYKKGAVIVFFVDDPENKVLLGPVDYTSTINSSMLIKS